MKRIKKEESEEIDESKDQSEDVSSSEEKPLKRSTRGKVEK
jgi:hypothetical protein